MMLILKKLDDKIAVADIEAFLEPALQGGFLKKTGRIEGIKIQMYLNTDTNIVEYHALVTVGPDSVGKRVIRMLNRKACHGKLINVVEYQFRHRDNDRRQTFTPAIQNRRKLDRRRKNLQTQDITLARKGHKIDYGLLNLNQA